VAAVDHELEETYGGHVEVDGLEGRKERREEWARRWTRSDAPSSMVLVIELCIRGEGAKRSEGQVEPNHYYLSRVFLDSLRSSRPALTFSSLAW